MGRKPKELTSEQKIQVEALAAYLTQEQIADYFSLSRTTFYEMMKRDEEISERRKAIHEFLMLNHTDEEVRE